MKIYLSILILLCCAACTHISTDSTTMYDGFHYAIQKEAHEKNGAVVCAHPLASEAGSYILQQGGNAFDAAIATELALAVVYPGAGNIGGGGFMVAHMSSGKNMTLDFREKAPTAATQDMYLDATGEPIPHSSQWGVLSAGVPGTVAGICAQLKYAKLPLAKLIEPAIRFARDGFSISKSEAKYLNADHDRFKQYNPEGCAFIKNTPWKEGDTLKQPELAHTLELIRDKGMAGFYGGETAAHITTVMQHDKGLITAADLTQYTAVWRAPILCNYRGYDVVTMPLPSSGGVCLKQMLYMLGRFPLSNEGFHTVHSMQPVIEAERRSYADRAQYLGDADFIHVPVEALTSAAYLNTRMKDYDSTYATPSKNIKAGVLYEKEETTHLCVIDKEGNCVSVTTTLNGHYGSYRVVPGAGFILNDEMDDFSIKAGVANMYGLVGNTANAIAPNKRMLSSMTPVIVLKDNKPYMVAGTPGGSTIITSVLQTIMNVVDYHMTLSDAVNAPKYHHQWLPDTVYVEQNFPKPVLDSLTAIGYNIKQRGPIGRTEAILVQNGEYIVVGDGRGDDSVAGY